MKFKYKYSTTVKILFIVMYALAAVCFVWNLFRFIESAGSQIEMDSYKAISTVLCLVLPIVVSVFITAMLVSSYYKIDGNLLKVKFGFIGDEYKINEMASIVKNVKTDMLVVNFKDESTLNIVIAPKDFDDFSAEIIKSNKSVCYGETDAV